MSGLFGSYDFSGVAPSEGNDFDLLPVGSALVAITGKKEVANSDRSWIGMSIEFTVQEGDFAKRKLWRSFTLHYPANRDMERDGKSSLLGVLQAAGHPGPQSSEPIEGKRLVVKVIQKNDKKKGERVNDVAAWMPASKWPERTDKIARGKAGRYVDASMAAVFGASMAAQAPTGGKRDLDDEIPF
jgi:hypothetical protein